MRFRPREVRLPELVAVAELRRLAVDRTLQGRGIGRALVRDACLRMTAAADAVSIRAVIAHALSPRARDFYLRVGFEPSPLDPMTLMATLGRRAEAAQLSIREAQAVVTHVHVDHVGLKSCRRVS